MADGPLIIQRDNVDDIPRVGSDMPPWYTSPTRRLDWRVVAVLCAFAGLVLLALGLALWPVLFDEYASGPRRFVQVVAAALLLGVVLALLVGAAGLALRPWLIKQPGGITLTVLQAAQLDAQAVVSQHLAAQHAYAARPMPHVGALTITNPKADAPPLTPLEPESPLQAVPPDTWLDWIDERPHLILAAETKGGKSTTAQAILARRLQQGEPVFVIDPHSSDWFDLPSVGGGENWPQVERALRAIYDAYLDRLEERDTHKRETGKALHPEHFPRLTVLLDEANNTRLALDKARRGELSPWQEFARVLGSGARKVRVSIIMLCQSANVEDLGLSGAMRQNFTRIALDHRVARDMIRQDEPDHQRRADLYAALVGQRFPAVVALGGQVHALDRTGLDRLPTLHDTRVLAWDGWDYARAHAAPSVSASVSDPPDLLDSLLVQTQQTAQTARDEAQQDARSVPDGAPDGAVWNADTTDRRLDQLITLRRRGVSREAARNDHGIDFDNWEWTEAGRRIEAGHAA